jgi:hypothetical protein
MIRVLRRRFGSYRVGSNRGRRNFLNEKLHNLCLLSNIITQKRKRTGIVGHVACMKEICKISVGKSQDKK